MVSVGDRMYYREMGITIEVEVLEILDGVEEISYRLKPVRTLPAFLTEVSGLCPEFTVSREKPTLRPGKMKVLFSGQSGWHLDGGEYWAPEFRQYVEDRLVEVV